MIVYVCASTCPPADPPLWICAFFGPLYSGRVACHTAWIQEAKSRISSRKRLKSSTWPELPEPQHMLAHLRTHDMFGRTLHLAECYVVCFFEPTKAETTLTAWLSAQVWLSKFLVEIGVSDHAETCWGYCPAGSFLPGIVPQAACIFSRTSSLVKRWSWDTSELWTSGLHQTSSDFGISVHICPCKPATLHSEMRKSEKSHWNIPTMRFGSLVSTCIKVFFVEGTALSNHNFSRFGEGGPSNISMCVFPARILRLSSLYAFTYVSWSNS